MKSLLQRLKALSPLITEICRVSGTPGASIGVMHRGKTIYSEGFGFRDVENKLVPDENTIYYIASMSKAFTAAAIASLVEGKHFEWDTPIIQVLPDFEQRDATIKSEANIVDFLSHRTGLAPKNSIWMVDNGHLSMDHNQTLRTISYLEHVYDFRQRWLYSNWGYALADVVLIRESKASWGDVLRRLIFEPLGMSRSITNHKTKLDNVAKAYMSLANGTPFHVPRPDVEDGTLMEGAAGVQSSVHDLLLFYKALILAAKDQSTNNRTSTPGSPLKQTNTLWTPQVALSPEPSKLQRAYGIGWILTDLPGTLGGVGLNGMYLDKAPVVGKGLSKSRRVIHHQGSLVSFLSNVLLLPDTDTAVVVLTNSMARNDAADWLGEMILETILDNPNKNDYVALATESAKNSVELWPNMARELESRRVHGTSPRPLKNYVGKYYNCVANWFLEIYEDADTLFFCRQGIRSQSYHLTHYNYDVFTWLLTRDEDVRRGMFPNTFAAFYMLRFKANEEGAINRVVWRHDPFVEEGETFVKTGVNGLHAPIVVDDAKERDQHVLAT